MKIGFFWRNFLFYLSLIITILILFSIIPFHNSNHSSFYQIIIPWELTSWVKAILVGILVSFLFSGIHNFIIKKRLSVLYEAVEKLMDFDAKKISFSGMGEFETLARKLNDIGETLKARVDEQENEKNRLKTILEAMLEGVLVTDNRLKVQIINPALEKMFSINSQVDDEKSVMEMIRDERVNQYLREVIDKKDTLKNEIAISHDQERKYVIMNVAPFFKGEELLGTVSIFSDITELRKLENIRKDFMANVSHELKTPLTNILGYAETLSGGALLDEEFCQRFVNKIENNARYLQNLVKDLLNLAAIEYGQWKLNFENINLLSVLRELKTFYQDECDEKEIALEFQVDENLNLHVDPQSLRQVLGNLVDNALKYSKAHGKIIVKSMIENNEIIISVQDGGVGLSEADAARVFERFFRADKSRSEKGTGLGLAIVKHLVQSHQGRVEVDSKLGEGSCFSVIFPCPV